MSIYGTNDDKDTDLNDEDNGQHTMAVLNTLGGGGEDPLAPGEPLGLDPDAGKAKLSGSSLAVGVVVVLSAAALLGMRMTLKAVASNDEKVSSAINEIDIFMSQNTAAKQVGSPGPISAPDDESAKIFEELQYDPTEVQIPAEDIEINPFDLSKIVKVVMGPTDTTPTSDPRQVAVIRAKAEKAKLKVDSISGNMAFINGDLYRVGEKIGNSGFILDSIEGLTCTIKTTDAYSITLKLEYNR